MKRCRIVIFIIIFSMIVQLTAFYDSREIDDLAYVIAMGIDKNGENLVLTLMFAVPIAIGIGEQESGGGGKGSHLISVECNNILSGVKMADAYTSKEISFSHCKLLIISKELAEEGIRSLLDGIYRWKEFRPSMYISISLDSPKNELEKIQPVLEINPAKYLEMINRTYEYTGFLAESNIENIHLQMECTCIQAVANLSGISSDYDIYNTDFFSTAPYKGRNAVFEGDFIAGKSPISGNEATTFKGLAVFDADVMVGTLDGQETMYYRILRGDFESSLLTLPDPIERDRYIVIRISRVKSPDVKVSVEGDNPFIKIKVSLEGDFVSIDSGINYEQGENMRILEKEVNDFLCDEIYNLLEKTAREYHSDIFGYGKKMKYKFLTWDEWVDFGWLNKYKNSSFEVSVDFKIRRTGLTIFNTEVFGSKGGK